MIGPRVASLSLAALVLGLAPAASRAAAYTCNGLEATIVGTPEGDVIEGTDGDDVIVGLGSGDGDDYINAGAGNDTVCVGVPDEFRADWASVDGEEGNDTVLSLADHGTYGGAHGSAGNDLIVGFEYADGGDGDDTLRAGSFERVVFYNGDSGNDVIEGTNHDEGQPALRDYLVGGEGDDLLLGAGGPDILHPGEGNDRVDGGDGADLLRYADSLLPVSVDLSEGRIHIPGEAAPLYTGEVVDVEIVEGSSLADRITGDDGPNVLSGCGGSDVISGLGGDDRIYGLASVVDAEGNTDASLYVDPCRHAGFANGTRAMAGDVGAMMIDGGDGFDFCRGPNLRTNCEDPDPSGYSCNGLPATIVGVPGEDHIRGTPGDDVIVGRGGTATIFIEGRAGDDTICTGADPGTDERVDGGEGNDSLFGGSIFGSAAGGPGDDLIVGFGSAGGGEGNDVLRPSAISQVVYYRGGDGNDVLAGTDYDFDDYDNRDQLWGGDGDDVLLGGGGPDFLYPGTGNDEVDGGEGRDLLGYQDSWLSVSVDISTGRSEMPAGIDPVFRGEVRGIEDIEGTALSDRITGDDGPNIITGCGGSDVVSGLGGDDRIYGLTGTFDEDGGVEVSNHLDWCGNSPPTFIHDLASDAPGQMTIDGGEGFDFCRGPNWRTNCEEGEGL